MIKRPLSYLNQLEKYEFKSILKLKMWIGIPISCVVFKNHQISPPRIFPLPRVLQIWHRTIFNFSSTKGFKFRFLNLNVIVAVFNFWVAHLFGIYSYFMDSFANFFPNSLSLKVQRNLLLGTTLKLNSIFIWKITLPRLSKQVSFWTLNEFFPLS